MTLEVLDRERLARALELAQQSIGLSEPNPRVGCVLADATGQVIAEGFTQEAGGAHAEAHALQRAEATGLSLRGGTAWVSLEPCAHHGRTPPCCDALIRAGLRRVVIAIGDPFPAVAGEGIRRLRAAGIEVDLLEDGDPLHQAARDLNIGFFSRVQRGRPWIRLKIAMSLDGRTALNNGASQWITGMPARIDTHRWRKRASAVLTGIGTVLADRPRLDVRHVTTARQPLRIVLDSSLRTPVDAPILRPPGACRVLTSGSALAARASALREAGAVVIEGVDDQNGKVDLEWAVRHLASLDFNEVHIEAGATLAGAFVGKRLVDELLVYQAPLLLGPGRGAVEWPALEQLSQAVSLETATIDLIGKDLRWRMLCSQPPGQNASAYLTTGSQQSSSDSASL